MLVASLKTQTFLPTGEWSVDFVEQLRSKKNTTQAFVWTGGHQSLSWSTGFWSCWKPVGRGHPPFSWDNGTKARLKITSNCLIFCLLHSCATRLTLVQDVGSQPDSRWVFLPCQAKASEFCWRWAPNLPTLKLNWSAVKLSLNPRLPGCQAILCTHARSFLGSWFKLHFSPDDKSSFFKCHDAMFLSPFTFTFVRVVRSAHAMMNWILWTWKNSWWLLDDKIPCVVQLGARLPEQRCSCGTRPCSDKVRKCSRREQFGNSGWTEGHKFARKPLKKLSRGTQFPELSNWVWKWHRFCLRAGC